MTKKKVAASKFLSLVLRHKPEVIGIELDQNGWVEVKVLLSQMAMHGRKLSRELLVEVVEENDKKRYAFSNDGLRIRANQGHSVEVELRLKSLTPPACLFHGTAERFLIPIMSEGLKKMGRQHVHLSPDLETAAAVGVRHGRLVTLAVDSAKMGASGHTFFLSANGVWLTDHVPPAFLTQHFAT